MNLKSSGRPVPLFILVCLMVSLAVFHAGCSPATDPSQVSTSTASIEELVGIWNGSTLDENKMPIPVKLDITENYAELNYGPNRNCTSKSVLADSDLESAKFRFTEADGGWCRKLTDGIMELSLDDSRNLRVHVYNPKKETDETMSLSK